MGKLKQWNNMQRRDNWTIEIPSFLALKYEGYSYENRESRWTEVQHIKLTFKGGTVGQWGLKSQKIKRKSEKNPFTWRFIIIGVL